MIPLHLEQELLAESVRKTGAGVVVSPKSAQDLFHQLALLLNGNECHLAAATLREKYGQKDEGRIDRMIAILERFL